VSEVKTDHQLTNSSEDPVRSDAISQSASGYFECAVGKGKRCSPTPTLWGLMCEAPCSDRVSESSVRQNRLNIRQHLELFKVHAQIHDVQPIGN
jgi:hypothetical protein